MKKIIAAVMFLTALSLSAVPAKAQISSALSVSPVIFNVSLSPGKIYHYSLKIKNGLDAPVPLQVEPENLDLLQQDETDSALRSIIPWVRLEDRNMIIEANGTRTIDFTVSVPDKVPLGGYYGMLYLRPFSRATPDKATDVTSKIGVLLLGSIGVQEVPLNKVELLSARFTKPAYSSPDVALQFGVKNTALNHFSAKPFVRISPFLGRAQDLPLEEKIIFPGRERTWNIPIRLQQYPMLWYRADLTVSVGGGIQKKAVFYFLAFPFVETVAFAFAILVISAMIKGRKRIGRAIRVFFRG